jgi:hypothetical protein
MSDKLISKPFFSEAYHNKQAKLISGNGLEDSASLSLARDDVFCDFYFFEIII